jgi:hypothetical protein
MVRHIRRQVLVTPPAYATPATPKPLGQLAARRLPRRSEISSTTMVVVGDVEDPQARAARLWVSPTLVPTQVGGLPMTAVGDALFAGDAIPRWLPAADCDR